MIFVAVGMNRQVFFSSPKILLIVSFVLLLMTFGIGYLYGTMAKSFHVAESRVITQTMLTTIKSSGFSVVTALTLFGREAAIPSAVLAVVVLIYLIYLSVKVDKVKIEL